MGYGFFQFNGQWYPYLRQRNHPHGNERTVEVPIIQRHTWKHHPTDTLEIGDTLNKYTPTHHTVLDKYATRNGVIQQDVANLDAVEAYDTIVSISTLEHVGYDESEYGGPETTDPKKVLTAVANLKTALKPGGSLLFTTPYDYNPHFDHHIEQDAFNLTRLHFMRRTHDTTTHHVDAECPNCGEHHTYHVDIPLNRWEQCSWTQVQDTSYGDPHPYANGIIIAYYEKTLED